MEMKKELKSVVKRAKYCPVKRVSHCPVQHISRNQEITRLKSERREVIPRFDFYLRCNKHVAPSYVRYVTELLGEDHLTWENGSVIMLECSTGTGKTTYVKKLIYSGLRVLYLTNRKANRLQVAESFGLHHKDECQVYNSEICSYQKLEKNLSMDISYLDTFDLIVMDEAHYFLTDSLFNPQVNISLRKIISTHVARKIFMSATLKDMLPIILNYYNHWNDVQRMKKLHFYQMRINHQIIRNIKNIPNTEALLDEVTLNDGKSLVFVDSKEVGFGLLNELKVRNVDATFICSENASSSDKSGMTYQNLISKQMFCEKVLVCTSVADNGLEIKDTELKRIVLFDNCKTEIKQEIGRKRPVNQNDWVDILIMDNTQHKLRNSRKRTLAKIDEMKEIHAILNFYHKPPASVMQEDNIGKGCRKTLFYEFETGRFYPNILGINQLFILARDLKELADSDDVFTKKVGWLQESTDLIINGEIISDTNQIKANLFFKKIKDYLPFRFHKRDPSYKQLQAIFTSLCFEVMGVDKAKGHRSNRYLSMEKMKDVIDEYNIPITFIEDDDGFEVLITQPTMPQTNSKEREE